MCIGGLLCACVPASDRALPRTPQDELFSPVFTQDGVVPEYDSNLLYREGLNHKVCSGSWLPCGAGEL